MAIKNTPFNGTTDKKSVCPTLTILNVYAPSDSTDRTCFFTQLETSLTHLDFNGFVCFGGDFNCRMDSAIDRNGKEPHPASIMPLARTLTTFSLIDIWRTCNPSTRQYTWCRCFDGCLSLTRLDRFYINDDFLIL